MERRGGGVNLQNQQSQVLEERSRFAGKQKFTQRKRLLAGGFFKLRGADEKQRELPRCRGGGGGKGESWAGKLLESANRHLEGRNAHVSDEKPSRESKVGGASISAGRFRFRRKKTTGKGGERKKR